MDTISKDSINVGASSVQTYKRSGLQINTEPIEEIIVFEGTNIAANTTKVFKPVSALKLINIFAFGFSGNITFSVKLGTIVLNNYTFNAASSAVGNSLNGLIVDPRFELTVVAGSAISYLQINAKQVYADLVGSV